MQGNSTGMLEARVPVSYEAVGAPEDDFTSQPSLGLLGRLFIGYKLTYFVKNTWLKLHFNQVRLLKPSLFAPETQIRLKKGGGGLVGFAFPLLKRSSSEIVVNAQLLESPLLV